MTIITNAANAGDPQTSIIQPPKSRNRFRLKAKYPLEWEEQAWFFIWLNKSQSEIIREVAHHIPNQTTRTVGEGVKLKRMGKKKGIPDVFIPFPVEPYHGLYIEFKRRCDSLPDKDQLRMMNNLSKLGYFVDVAFGWQHAKEICEKYLGKRMN